MDFDLPCDIQYYILNGFLDDPIDSKYSFGN